MAGLEGSDDPGTYRMAIIDNATHALLIDGEDVAPSRTRTAGTVWIDEHLAIGSEMPHGGVKGSGSART